MGEIPVNHQIGFRFALTGARDRLAVAGIRGVDLYKLEISEDEISVRHLRSLEGSHKDLVSELTWSESCRMSEFGNLLATACDGGVVNVWNSAGERITGWSEIPSISALVWTNPGNSIGDFRSPFLVVGLERGKVRVYEGVSGNFCEEIGNEDIQVEDVGAVVDENSGTAFLAVLGMNSRSLRVASRKLDVWKTKNIQVSTGVPSEIKSQD
jgi:WD40 repeat protein